MTLLASLCVLHYLTACDKHEKPLPSARESGEIVVLTVNSPTTYYEDASDQFAGLDHDLINAFADELGLKPRFEVLSSSAALIPALKARRGHVAAGSLVPSLEGDKYVRFGLPYQTIRHQVIYRTDRPKPMSIKNLVGLHLGVLAGSSQAERLTELRRQYPGLVWSEFESQSSEDLLRRVSDGSLDAVIADSNSIQLSYYAYPNIDIAFDLNGLEELAWAFPLAGDDYLYNASQEFFGRIQKDGTLKRMIDRYYANSSQLKRIDAAAFLEKVQTVLPRYRLLFQDAEDISGVDWRLLAAIAYQESHWDPLATSPTGVRGLMMLTEETATRMGIKDRLDPKENITAGAEYLVKLKEGLPARILEPDRTWLAIAAYNQGLGHLEDARILTQRQKRNPDSWQDVKAALPLLSDPEHYANLKLGYARGGEALAMTENVRTYYDILSRLEKPYKAVAESSSIPSAEQAPIAASAVR
jgi:membrane-bound lytic murein transglycosylase F